MARRRTQAGDRVDRRPAGHPHRRPPRRTSRRSGSAGSAASRAGAAHLDEAARLHPARAPRGGRGARAGSRRRPRRGRLAPPAARRPASEPGRGRGPDDRDRRGRLRHRRTRGRGLGLPSEDGDVAALEARYPEFRFRPRIGTELWLGDRGALRVTAHVLDSHPVERGEVFGYRGRTIPRTGTILVCLRRHRARHRAGGPDRRGQRACTSGSLARGGLDALGLAKSPYTVGGQGALLRRAPAHAVLDAVPALRGRRCRRSARGRGPGAVHRDDLRRRRDQPRSLGLVEHLGSAARCRARPVPSGRARRRRAP